MSVLDITPIKSHVYTGVGVYEFDFKTYLSTDLVCTVLMPDGSTRSLVKDTDYSVSIAADPLVGGSITLLVDNNPTATKLQILREVPFTQEVDWENGGPLDQPLLTRSMDKLTMLLQQMQATVGGRVLTSNWRGDWVTSTRYYLKDLLRGPNGNWYACQTEHVSSVFSTELAAGYWSLVLDISTIGGANVPDPSVGTNEQVIKVSGGAYVLGALDTDGLAAEAVTADKIANGAITQDKIANGAITQDKIANGAITQDKLVAVFSAMAGVVPNCQVQGFGITNTGANELTVTKGQCLDSTLSRTLSVSASTILGTAQGVPTSNNTVFVVAAVILTNGTHTCRAYADEAAMAADVGVSITHYTWIGWWQNNGSGVAKAGRLLGVGDGLAELWWMKASENAVISQTAVPANCNTAVSLSSYLPDSSRVAGVAMGGQSATASQNVVFGVDGTNVIARIVTFNAQLGDTEGSGWGDGKFTFIPITNNTIYWGRGTIAASSTSDLRLQATRFRR